MSTAVGHRSVHHSEQSWNPAAAVVAAAVFTADDEGPIDINRSEVEDFMLPLASTVA